MGDLCSEALGSHDGSIRFTELHVGSRKVSCLFPLETWAVLGFLWLPPLGDDDELDDASNNSYINNID